LVLYGLPLTGPHIRAIQQGDGRRQKVRDNIKGEKKLIELKRNTSTCETENRKRG